MHVAITHRLLAVSVALLLTGCSSLTDPDRAAEHPEPGQDPFTSPDYVPRENPIRLSSALGADDVDEEAEQAREERIQELEEKLARMEAERRSERTADREPIAVDGPRTRVAVLLDTPLRDRLNPALEGVSRDYPVRLLSDGATRTALSDAGCDPASPADCADALRQYPGVRLLVTFSGDTTDQVTMRYHDLELGGTPRSRTLNLPEADGRVPDRALDSLADDVFATGLELTRTGPWVARVFSREGDGWAINAGEASGLEVGDRLQVHRPGRVIRGPGGQAAGYVRGEAVGTVEVDALAGGDVAVVTVVDGQAPADEDVLIPVE